MTKLSRNNRAKKLRRKTSKNSGMARSSTKKDIFSAERLCAGRPILRPQQLELVWWRHCLRFGKVIVEHWRLVLAMFFVTVSIFSLILGRLPPVVVLTSDLKSYTIIPGGLLEESHTVKWNRRDCVSVTVTADLIDAFGYMHTFASKTLGLTRRPTLTAREWFIPITMPPGRAVYQGRLSLSCFPYFNVWPIVVEAHPLTFTVLPLEKL